MHADRRPAPDPTVTLWDGSTRPLSAFWREQRTVLVFLRHLGWLFCREQVAQLRHAADAFRQADAQVVLVSMGTPEQTAAFRKKFDLPFAMISDPGQALYKAFNIGTMSLISTFMPSVAARAASALIKGHGVGIPHGDIRRLPAVFVIGTDGTITHRHVGRDAADHPATEAILAVL